MKYSNSILLILAVLLLSACGSGEEEQRLTQLFQDKAQENKILQEKLQHAETVVEQLNIKMIEQDVIITEHPLLLNKHAAIQVQLEKVSAIMAQLAEQMDSVNKNNKKLEQDNLSLKEELTGSLAQVSNITEKLAAEEIKVTTLLDSIVQKEDENKELSELLGNKDVESDHLQQQIQLQQTMINSLAEKLSSKEAQVNALMGSFEK